MGSIEQFFSFLSTLYSPRRAGITVFMVIGITLCLIFLEPTFNRWLTPVLKPVTENYLGYIAILTTALGVGLSVVTFSFCEKLYKWINQAGLLLTSKIKTRAQKMEDEASQKKTEAKFVQDFLDAYPHLDNNMIEILKYLSLQGNMSFSSNQAVAFLYKKQWISAVVQVDKNRYVFKINELIKDHVLDYFWQEINFNIQNALSSSEPAIKAIITLFASDVPNDAHRIEYSDFYSADAQTILKNCFTLSGYNKFFTVSFKDYYKNTFEHSMSKALKEEIEIEIIDAHAYTEDKIL